MRDLINGRLLESIASAIRSRNTSFGKKNSILPIAKLVAIIAVAFVLMVPFFGSASPDVDVFPAAITVEEAESEGLTKSELSRLGSEAMAQIEENDLLGDLVTFSDRLTEFAGGDSEVNIEDRYLLQAAAALTNPEPLTSISAASQFANPNVREPFGGNAAPAGAETTQLVVMAVAGDPGAPFRQAYTSDAAGLTAALTDLWNNGDSDTTYVMYFGANVTIAAATLANTGAAGTFSGLQDRVSGLILTGSATDPVVDTPAMSATAAGPRALTRAGGAGTNSFFGSNILIRNMQHNLGTNVFMNGNDLTLAGNSWETASTTYYGGSNTGTITPPDGTARINVYSTGNQATAGNSTSTFVGGMYVGTLNGNTEINIAGSSGNLINIRGGGVGTGTGAAVRANVNGNVSTAITGLASNTGGLNSYVGGAVFGHISGQVTNHVSGQGRFSTLHAVDGDLGSASISGTGTGSGYFVGGSSNGNIGTALPAPSSIDTTNLHVAGAHTELADVTDYAISTYLDSRNYTFGRKVFVGANTRNGEINGNIINVVRAGHRTAATGSTAAAGAGSFISMSMIGGFDTRIGGTWSNNFTSAANATISDASVAAGIAAARTAANPANTIRMYGNTVNVVRGGSLGQGLTTAGASAASTEFGWFRGAGWGGFIEGDVYSAVGTEDLAYSRHMSTYVNRVQPVSSAVGAGNARQGLAGSFDLVGGGGNVLGGATAHNAIMIVGDTTLVQAHTLARWTYGGGFSGVIVGDTRNELHRGIADVVQGGGYWNRAIVGDASVHVYGGQVDWFLAGGSWYTQAIDGNVGVTVHDNNPPAIINAAMGGSYGWTGVTIANLYTGHARISGDSSVTVYGGRFEGVPHIVIVNIGNGFAPGVAYNGAIFGNAIMTIDLRGNEYGFSTSAANPVSAGRRLGASGNSVLGLNRNNTLELNIFTDDDGADYLQGMNIFGDAAAANVGNTRAGYITMNINAPGSNIGNLYATNYENLTGGTGTGRMLLRDVEVNLVSANTINGLSTGNGFTSTAAAIMSNNTFPNQVAAQSMAANRHAIINVGPQSDDPADPLGERDGNIPANGRPRVINIGGVGVSGFTEMNINDRIISATGAGAAIRNGGARATHANFASYNQFGNVTVQAGEGLGSAGFGVRGNNAASVIVAGALEVEGDGYAYVQSQGIINQAIFRDAHLNDNLLRWLRVGTAAESTFSPITTWFGASSGFHVFTVNPDRMRAQEVTPFNLEGICETTGRTFIGDNMIPGSGSDGHAVAIPASIYRWNVTEGEGVISHNVPVTLASDMAGLTQPPGGHLLAIGDQGPFPNTSRSGRIAVPSANIPSPIPWPEFTFRPDAGLGEWIEGVQVIRTDSGLTTPPNLNCTFMDEDDLRDYFEDFLDGNLPRNFTWLAGDPARTANPDRANDRFFGHDITSQFTSEREIEATNVLITEAEAAAIVNYRDVLEWTDAAGRPWFRHNITDTMLDEIRTPLAAGVYARPHPVTYTVGRNVPDPHADRTSMTVNVTVVRNGSIISDCRQFGVFAVDATMAYEVAQTVNRATLDADYTRAIAFDATGATFTPTIGPATVVADINATTQAQLPRDVDVTYSFLPASSTADPVSIDVIVTIVEDAFDFIFTKFSQNGTTPLEGVEFNLYRAAVPGPGWNFAAPIQRISDVDGEVVFNGLDSGTFLLREYRALAGYESPLGYWIVTVNTATDTVTVVSQANAHDFIYDDGDWSLVNLTGGNVNWRVSKEISGNFADPDGLYTFRLWILCAAGNPVLPYQTPSADMIAGTGLVRSVTTVLANGTTTTAYTNLAVTATGYIEMPGFGANIESFTIHGLPSTWQVRAIELNPPAGYEVTFVDSANPAVRVEAADTGLRVLGVENRSFDFRNRFEYIPTGVTVAGGTIAIVVMFAATVSTMAALSAKRRKDIEAVPVLGATNGVNVNTYADSGQTVRQSAKMGGQGLLEKADKAVVRIVSMLSRSIR